MAKPVFIDDALQAETSALELRDSKSRANAGIVIFEHRMFNQRGELVCQPKRIAFLQKQPT